MAASTRTGFSLKLPRRRRRLHRRPCCHGRRRRTLPSCRSTPGGKCINWRTGEPLLRTTDAGGRTEGRQRNTSLKWNIQPDGLWDGSMMESGEEGGGDGERCMGSAIRGCTIARPPSAQITEIRRGRGRDRPGKKEDDDSNLAQGSGRSVAAPRYRFASLART